LPINHCNDSNLVTDMLSPHQGGWIISGGMNEGVMKQVGDAVHDHLVAQGSKAGLVAFGIATWGCVKGKKTLVNEGVSVIAPWGCWSGTETLELSFP